MAKNQEPESQTKGQQPEIGISICPGITTWNQKPTRRNCNHRAQCRGGSEIYTVMCERMHQSSTSDVLWLMDPNCRDPDLLLQKIFSQISKFYLKNMANKPAFYLPKLSGCWERQKFFSQYHTCLGRSIEGLQLCCSQSSKFKRNYIHLTFLYFFLRCKFQIH